MIRVSERKRRDAAYRDSIDAIRAYIDGEDADLFNLLDAASTEDPLATAYRLTKLAASAVQELAAERQEGTSTILHGLLDADGEVSAAPSDLRFTRNELLWINNALNAILNGPQAIEYWEFHALIGGSPEDVQDLLRKVNDRVGELRLADPEW